MLEEDIVISIIFKEDRNTLGYIFKGTGAKW